jgi:hypothetical protein
MWLMTNYSEWVNTNEGQLKGFLKQYNDWVFGADPYPKQKPKMLFVHGSIGSPEVREESHDIKRGEPIIVHVIGTNFVKEDRDANGNIINDDNQIIRACQDEEGTDQCDFVKIKGPGDKDWTSLAQHVSVVRSTPDRFDANNSDLDKWKPEMRRGDRRGAWSSKLLVLEVPETANTGVYELSCGGHGSDDYRQRADFKITVQ